MSLEMLLKVFLLSQRAQFLLGLFHVNFDRHFLLATPLFLNNAPMYFCFRVAYIGVDPQVTMTI